MNHPVAYARRILVNLALDGLAFPGPVIALAG
jgi:hypothetical protein